MSKALGLFSGGLDSLVAALVLKRQGVEVTGITFVTPFFGAEKAIKSAKMIDIPLIVEPIGDIHLEMVKNPKYGYGKNMNPCIDCHAMMFRLAGQKMEEGGFDFLFSGEVLGQRPMSQNRNALQSVANYSDFSTRMLRPLSARVLPPTPVEEAGLVDRERLLDIQGRSRRRQEALLKEWGYTDYPSSGGGCLLTEKSFSNRLRDLFQHQPDATAADAELLKIGRQFRLSPQAKLILGRNKSNNEAITQNTREADITLRALNFSGPLGLITGSPTESEIEVAASIVVSYGKGQNEAQVEVLLQQNHKKWTTTVAPLDKGKIAEYMIE